ncbi:hypothetical protein ILUMI_00193 [Ignelater luminosus]|uniref:SCAN domain-containing protein n=1 Tax=Ignelater luminosus TaxID=2038154 RepID=A0A8K0GIN0_IGNLU|nr:hypothetical protein ILUMI_00193 [Ignelater luminosus]
MKDAVNAETASKNEVPAVTVEPSESLDSHYCGSCGKDVHAVCVISNEADEGYGGKVTCHNKQEIEKKRSVAHVGLQVQGAKMLKNSDAKFPPAKIGDNVCIRIPDVDRGRGDPRSVFAVVTNVEGAFYKLGIEHGVFKQLRSHHAISQTGPPNSKIEKQSDIGRSIYSDIGHFPTWRDVTHFDRFWALTVT